MKSYFLIFYLFFLSNRIFAQEKRDWDFGISYGIGGANATFMPALDVDYKKNTFNLGLSRNTWTFGYTRELMHLGKNKNFAWIATGAFVADFLPNSNFLKQIWTPDYFNRPKDKNGEFIFLAYSGFRAQFLKRCYASFQLGGGFSTPYSSNPNSQSYFGVAGQVGIGIRLFKVKKG